jgi:hypothetical protein
LALTACAPERPAADATTRPTEPGVADGTASQPSASIAAELVELTPTPHLSSNRPALPGSRSLRIEPCTATAFAALEGHIEVDRPADAAAERASKSYHLSQGDVLIATGNGVLLTHAVSRAIGVVLVARMPDCNDRAAVPSVDTTVLPAGVAPTQSWANGELPAEHAQGAGGTAASNLYVGVLSASGPVPEHVHDASWETIVTMQASGVLTFDGAPRRLGPHQIVQVPPKTRVSWTPDPQTKLVAIQAYLARSPR